MTGFRRGRWRTQARGGAWLPVENGYNSSHCQESPAASVKVHHRLQVGGRGLFDDQDRADGGLDLDREVFGRPQLRGQTGKGHADLYGHVPSSGVRVRHRVDVV